MSGNGSLSGSEFKEGNVLPTQLPTSTGGNVAAYESKQVGGRRKKLSSLRSVKRPRGVSTFRLRGGRKTKKSRKHRKSRKSFKLWPF
jgi:hypothetical protein